MIWIKVFSGIFTSKLGKLENSCNSYEVQKGLSLCGVIWVQFSSGSLIELPKICTTKCGTFETMHHLYHKCGTSVVQKTVLSLKNIVWCDLGSGVQAKL